ncbi:hypothetical protein GOBAR_AA27757 [Gossypium barbadense]|uniref:Uncharacterized protein n=1 Tax=Gossypium barbadense TaxID=3634 RepID=A0A2P5WP98_GOSBA|nr:hypothetical protein GOBAR_AA27757 [Gossypium barbadense]
MSGCPYSVDRPFVIYYDARKEPVKPKMIIEVPSHFPYKDNKAVPWKYDVNIVTPEDEKPKAMTGSVGEVSHFTRSGRCYSKEIEPVKKSSDSKQKGKAVMHEVEVEKEPVKPKMIIEVPSHFPYKDNKAVPWKYDVNIVTPEDEKPKAMTGSVGEVSHFTRSGRCYSKEIEPVKKSSDSKQKGKAVMHEVEVE